MEPTLLRRLDALRLHVRRPVASALGGSRRSARQGGSVEFADFREYHPGDDLRAVDWKAYGRLEKLFLKLYVDEQDLALHLLIDTSGSMAFGSPVSKGLYAKKLAAALGYVALSRSDRVTVAAAGETSVVPLRGLRGPGGIQPLLAHLSGLPTRGEAHLGRALNRYASLTREPGLTVVLSDFYDDDWQASLPALRARAFPVLLLHLLAPEEIDPEFQGEMRLIDAETGSAQEVALSPALLAAYRARLQEFCGDLEGFARRHDFGYVRFDTGGTLESAVLRLIGEHSVLR